ncbi:hypothetical protein [Chitinophaga rhizophila]|uniref:Uncharacterized protein n=1 Tax=Chitinophaga rhizophila TaxID=2866212 RepID=A0ABS7GKD8_9BACT|nr:hypothetical protein [Chitinophaga rhizophila]MBW8687751.1 hypothetical protein [Chitinophaga rhizophila]
MEQTLTLMPAVHDAGSFVNAEQAQFLIADWQQTYPQGIFSILYGRHLFDQLLAAPDCVGIRIFNGINTGNKQAFVFVAVNAAGTSILSYELLTDSGPVQVNNTIWDVGVPCPPFCDEPPVGQAYLWRRPIDPSLNMKEIGRSISYEKATIMVGAWQQQFPGMPAAFFFTRDVITAMLSVPGCAGVAIYNGIDKEQEQTLILTPADTTGRCIFNYTTITAEGTCLSDVQLLTGGMKQQVSL